MTSDQEYDSDEEGDRIKGDLGDEGDRRRSDLKERVDRRKGDEYLKDDREGDVGERGDSDEKHGYEKKKGKRKRRSRRIVRREKEAMKKWREAWWNDRDEVEEGNLKTWGRMVEEHRRRRGWRV